MYQELNIHSRSLLAHLCTQEPLTTASSSDLLRQIPFHRWDGSSGRKVQTTATIASVDNGNDAFKGAMLYASAPSRDLRTKDGVTTWQVNDSEPFWIGEDALLFGKAESLPIGMTEERLPDERYHCFLFACLVELLLEAGYGSPSNGHQGAYHLYLSFGIPNEEVTRNGVKDTTSRALASIFNTPQMIRRTDEQDRVTTWVLCLVELHPYPQSFGSFVSWYYAPDGVPIETDIVKHVTLDIGGGQFHSCEVSLQHQAEGPTKLRMAASLLDEGTIAIARAVRESIRAQYPGVRLTDAEAQQVLVKKRVTIGGHSTRVDTLTTDIIATRSHRLLTHIRHLLQEEQSFLLFTGGGSILLAEHLQQLVREKRHQQSFLFIPKELASVLNAIGGYVLAQTSARRVKERMQAIQQEVQ